MPAPREEAGACQEQGCGSRVQGWPFTNEALERSEGGSGLLGARPEVRKPAGAPGDESPPPSRQPEGPLGAPIGQEGRGSDGGGQNQGQRDASDGAEARASRMKPEDDGDDRPEEGSVVPA